MNIKQLIDLAKKTSGMSFGEMANELGVKQSRISEWKSETHTPDTGEVAYFAEKAGLDVPRTVMEFQRSIDPRFTQIWERALGNLHAATNQAATPQPAISSKMSRDQTIRSLINVVIESLDTTPEQVQVKTMLSAVLNAFLEVQPTIATAPQSGEAKARGVADQKPRLRKSLRTSMNGFCRHRSRQEVRPQNWGQHWAIGPFFSSGFCAKDRFGRGVKHVGQQ